MISNKALEIKIELTRKIASDYAGTLVFYLEDLMEVQEQLKKENKEYMLEMYKIKEKNIKKLIKELDKQFKEDLLKYIV